MSGERQGGTVVALVVAGVLISVGFAFGILLGAVLWS
jgi:hypothetical protein